MLRDYCFSLQPNTRNGGLIGLASVSIALQATHIRAYLDDIMPPILACLGDQNSTVRYYACESMYNVAKIGKEGSLIYFNELFDALSKLSADPEMSVRDGADLLNNLLKDIITLYTVDSGHRHEDPEKIAVDPFQSAPLKTPFSVPKFIPILAERSQVRHPYTRHFLVQWLYVLSTIPNVDLIQYLPDFLQGLIQFLGDSSGEVRQSTSKVLESFLEDISVVSKCEIKKKMKVEQLELPNDKLADALQPGDHVHVDYAKIVEILRPYLDSSVEDIHAMALKWIGAFIQFSPNVVVDNTPYILGPTLKSLSDSQTEAIRSIAANTNRDLFALIRSLPVADKSDVYFMQGDSSVRTQATDASSATSILTTATGQSSSGLSKFTDSLKSALSGGNTGSGSAPNSQRERDRTASPTRMPRKDSQTYAGAVQSINTPSIHQVVEDAATTINDGLLPEKQVKAENDDYPPIFAFEPTIKVLTTLLEHPSEETRVAALEWFIMLHRKAPHRVLPATRMYVDVYGMQKTRSKRTFSDPKKTQIAVKVEQADPSAVYGEKEEDVFAILLGVISDESDIVVKRALHLLAQISSMATDSAYFTQFIHSVILLFLHDRRLLTSRGSLILRQLCYSLNAERVYRAMAEILQEGHESLTIRSALAERRKATLQTGQTDMTEEEEAIGFVSVMVQQLNFILITAPEMQDMRWKLRNIEHKENMMLFQQIYQRLHRQYTFNFS